MAVTGCECDACKIKKPAFHTGYENVMPIVFEKINKRPYKCPCCDGHGYREGLKCKSCNSGVVWG
jgi:hypothetical protein